MVTLSALRSAQSANILTVQRAVAELSARGRRLESDMRRLRRSASLLEPKDLIDHHKNLKAVAALALSASNALRKLNALKP